MKSLKDGYFNSQELPVCPASSLVFLKAMFLAQWASWWNCWLDFYWNLHKALWGESACIVHCSTWANPVIWDSFTWDYVVVTSMGECCSLTDLPGSLLSCSELADIRCIILPVQAISATINPAVSHPDCSLTHSRCPESALRCLRVSRTWAVRLATLIMLSYYPG